MRTFLSEFDLFQEVYLTTDPYKLKRIITGVTFSGKNCRYCLACGEVETWHYPEEFKSYDVANGNAAGFKSSSTE